LVAGKITPLLVPSSVTLAEFETQLAGPANVPACSNAYARAFPSLATRSDLD